MTWLARSRPATVAPAVRPRPPKTSIWSKSAIPCADAPSAKELDLRLAKPQEIRRRGGNRPVDREYRDLEFVSGLHRAAEHEAMRHVEALYRPRARPAGSPRHLAIDPDFRIVVDIHAKYRHCPRSVEACGIHRDRQGRAEPE